MSAAFAAESTRLVDYGARRLRSLCAGAGFAGETERVVSTFRRLLHGWGDLPVGASTGWVSNISDDNAPIELSVAIVGGRPEVRVLMEAQAPEPTLAAHREAALAFNRFLGEEMGADLSRLETVLDIFCPEDMTGSFALWNAVCFSPGRAPLFKAYLNPQARGLAEARALTEKALVRLGLDRSFGVLGCKAARRGPQLDEVKYFALDLAASPEARVKIYVHHHRATPEDLETACSAARTYVPGEALGFARAMAEGARLLSARSPFTCSAFVSGDDERPTEVALYVPVCAYARDDGVIRDRVVRYMRSRDIDSSLYTRILDSFAHRPLDAGVGMQSWAALRHDHGDVRLTVYLSTESNRVFCPGTIPAATVDPLAQTTAEAVVRRIAEDDLAHHPFLRRLMRDEPDASLVWLLIANAYEGTSRHFVRWLASLTARVPDDRVRCLLARQLNQEMGDGDYSRAHSVMMRRFLEGIEPWRPARPSNVKLAPGRHLGKRLAKHYLADDPHESLATLMAGEICAHQLIRCVARLIRRLPAAALSPRASEWLDLHDQLEGDHAEESIDLARLVPRDPIAVHAVLRGAVGLHRALWLFLDELYAQCFAHPASEDESARPSASPLSVSRPSFTTTPEADRPSASPPSAGSPDGDRITSTPPSAGPITELLDRPDRDRASAVPSSVVPVSTVRSVA